MRFFHGEKRSGPYFEGWYLKHQSRTGRTLAMIPAFHIDSVSRRSASLQVISESGSWWLEYPETEFQPLGDPFGGRLGPLRFGCSGVEAGISQEGLSLQGRLTYGPFTPLKSDIMGPFRFFSGMQCSHGVISMGHPLEGTVRLNGETIDFSGGTGYIETDRGRSFPESYLWTQCLWQDAGPASLMLAAASIPLPVGGFTGCICAILHKGREYRLATYRGAKIRKWDRSGLAVRQGKYRLTAELLEAQGQPLHAPVEGCMNRTIHESLCATVRYSFWQGEDLLFQQTDRRASFEQYPRATSAAQRPAARFAAAGWARLPFGSPPESPPGSPPGCGENPPASP